jgi:hypothetical protein
VLNKRANRGSEIAEETLENKKSLFLAILHDFFGDKWHLSLALIVVFLFWPLVAFRNSISFDPVDFTEEWLKLGAGGFVVLLIIEITRRRQEEAADVRRKREQVENVFIRPVEQMLFLIQSINQGPDKSRALRNNLLSRWKSLYPLLNAGNAQGLLDGLDVLDLLVDLDLERCENLIEAMASQDGTLQVDKSESEELEGLLTSFKDKVAAHLRTR